MAEGTPVPENPATISVLTLSRVGKELGYRVPKALAGAVRVGSLVRVPLGRRAELGVVRRLEAPGDFPLDRLKMILAVVQPHPVLTGELLQLAQWMARYYACSQEQVFEVMIPAPVRKGMRRARRARLRPGREPEAEEWARLRRRAPKQAALLEFLRGQEEGRSVPKAVALDRLGVSAASCAGLVEKGWVVEEWEEKHREAYADELPGAESAPAEEHPLNPEQAAAVESIGASLTAGQFATHLLHGVTGSGKTEVYLQVLRRVLAEGGSALLLVPEIALTPQTVARLRARMERQGLRPAVWHSFLSEGERYDSWESVASGTARVVVGARSAVFAPLPNLRLVVVDEEHEPAYKQEETPRYHGRDVAVYRAFLNRAVCVLGSATPALESLYNVERGKYRLNRLTKRIDDRRLPTIHVVDMKREARGDHGPGLFSRALLDRLRERLERKEQIILFLNRRGYHTSLLCPDCEYLATCDHCSVTLTYHRAENLLRCHFCGLERPAPEICPCCRSPKIRWRGTGTQRLEDLARKLLPQARIVRLDTDSMSRKNLFREILADFRRGKIDILVGTQMIAKGLDFPNVTLVGLVDADISLHVPDFRAAERTFQLLVQVAGRAGRGDVAGEVVVQTFLPYSPPIQFARRQDFEGFLTEELEQRREYHYPPFRHLIHHVFRGRNSEKVSFFAEAFVRQVEALGVPELEVRGPAAAPVERIKDLYRHQVWYFLPQVLPGLDRLIELRRSFKLDPEVSDQIDVDPVNLV